MDRNEAITLFKDMGETFKAELIEDLPDTETITVYKQGKWFDLCRGPHLPSTGKVGKAFKLMKVAGAIGGAMLKTRNCNVYTARLGRPKKSSMHI